jgi:hypothetical protein
MRRLVAVIAGLTISLGVMGIVPAQATHCGADNLATCQNPVTVIAIEGIGKVCHAAVGLVRTPSLAHDCVYKMNDPSWADKSVSPFNPHPDQGLYWPGLGPGGVGPYVLAISGTTTPGTNVCVASVGGPGCSSFSEGKLDDGQQAAGTGAHCGSSSGTGTITFTSADNTLRTEGISNWTQSAATILPLQGYITKVNNVAQPASARPTLVGFTSSRGFSGGGNCGITQATVQFQVEGMVVTF